VLRLELVEGGLGLSERICVLFDLGVHLLCVFLVFLDALDDFVFKDFHAPLDFAHALRERGVGLLGAVALALVAHHEKLGLQVFTVVQVLLI
jgi:hypothetical protein